MEDTRDVIEKTKEYIAYIEEHYTNVLLAFCEFKEKSGFHEDFLLQLEKEVLSHDYSKLSEEEFVQYRKTFFPTKYEEELANKSYGISAKLLNEINFNKAWNHHKENNPHHWQNWGQMEYCWNIHASHMIIDWMAMSYKFGGTALEYYEKVKKDIEISEDKISFIEHTLNFIYKE